MPRPAASLRGVTPQSSSCSAQLVRRVSLPNAPSSKHIHREDDSSSIHLESCSPSRIRRACPFQIQESIKRSPIRVKVGSARLIRESAHTTPQSQIPIQLKSRGERTPVERYVPVPPQFHSAKQSNPSKKKKKNQENTNSPR
jgi:hypothetical protein